MLEALAESIDVRNVEWFDFKRNLPEQPPKQPMTCTDCGGELQLVAITDDDGRVLYNHPLPYLDSG